MAQTLSLTRIVVGDDFSECSRAAVARALDLARTLDAKVAILHVIDVGGLVHIGGEPITVLDSVLSTLTKQARASLAAEVGRIDPERRWIERAEILEGRPAETIVSFAREAGADLIVVGSHGRTGLKRLFLGSIAERTVRLAPCDVLVVHGRAPEPADAASASK